MPAPATGPELVELVEKSGLYEARELQNRLSQLENVSDKPVNLAASMVKHGIITKFQAKLLLMGKYRGFKMGPYILKDMIGQGGMGAVYEGRHTQLNRKVAVKVLTPGKDDDQQLAIERFMREARSAAALDHPNIVRLHDVGKFGTTHYLVMEFVEGDTLEQIIEKKGVIPCQKAVEYICQAAAGLQHAHEKGFIHRDIKPANLILTHDGTIKLLDMGLARSSDERDKLTANIDMNMIVGTADFISPEQAVNDPEIDIRSDIYSLGATFYMLVTGASPFKGNTAQKLVQHQVKDAPSLTRMDKTLPKELAEVVAKMMAKKKENRFRTPADVIAAFSPWLPNSGKVVAGLTQTNVGSGDTMETIVASSTKRLTKTILKAAENPRTKYLMIGGIAAGVLAAGAGLGYLLFGGSKTDSTVQNQNQNQNNNNNNRNNGQSNPVNAANNQSTQPISTPVKAIVPANLAIKSPGAVVSYTPSDLSPCAFTLKGMDIESGSKANFPSFMNVHCWKPESTGQFKVEKLDNVPVISFGSRIAPGTAQIRFDFETVDGNQLKPGKEYEFRCTYRTSGGASSSQMSIVTSKHEYLKGHTLPESPGGWKTESFKFTRGDEALSCNFDSTVPSANGFLSLAKFEVIDPELASQAIPLYWARFDKSPLIAKRIENPTQPVTITHEMGLPNGCRINHHNAKSVGEYAIVSVDGDKALQMKILSGRFGTQVHFDFDAEQPLPIGTSGVIRIVYRYEGQGSGLLAIEENAKGYVKHYSTALPVTGNKWKTIDVPFVRPDTPNPLCIIVNQGYSRTETEQATITIKSLDVFTNEPGKTPITAVAPTPTPDAGATGAVVYELPLAKSSPFDITVESGKDPNGTMPKWAGVQLHAWKPGSIGQFKLIDKGEGLELNISNLNETVSAQMMVQLEFELGQKLAVGKTYTVAVEYKTTNDGVGQIILQSEGFSTEAQAELSDTSGKWTRKVLSFKRAEGKPIRVGLNSLGFGEGNNLVIRKLTIHEGS